MKSWKKKALWHLVQFVELALQEEHELAQGLQVRSVGSAKNPSGHPARHEVLCKKKLGEHLEHSKEYLEVHAWQELSHFWQVRVFLS